MIMKSQGEIVGGEKKPKNEMRQCHIISNTNKKFPHQKKKLLFIFEKRNVSQEICDNALNSVSRVRRGT